VTGLLPQHPPVEEPVEDPQIIGLDDQASGSVFSALSADRARSILVELYREPATQSELADRVDTSIQNVNYHLEKLLAAELVSVVDQWYSEKGREMKVFAPNGPLVLLAGSGEQLDDARQVVEDSSTVDGTTKAGD
jgi:DNA-binding transcriptional ArsR family regulator